MPLKIPRLAWLAAPLVYFLYFFRLGGAGLVGPDEPRYAWIGRAMAETGDWVTPRLWGQPWFEKPALLYWLTGAGFRLGLGPDLAPRLPVALVSVGFLGFYWWALWREFGCRTAWMATCILGSSVAWIGFSQAGVPDLLLTATFSAAMLLALPWVAKRDARYMPIAAALFGVAALAKGLVPLALAAPLALRIGWARDWLRPKVVLAFCAVALPWYLVCYSRNGWPFFQELIVRHHFGRFASDALQHGQPWWFYLKILPFLLLPWMPLLFLALWRNGWSEPRRRFLALWTLFGLAIFSAAANKLPGYVLPLLPAIAAMAALALDEIEDAKVWLGACAALLAAFPIAAPILPAALANEWDAAPKLAFQWTWLLPAIPLGLVLALERNGRRLAAVATVVCATAVGLTYLKVQSQAEIERIASARALAAEARRHPGEVCTETLKRDWQYGLYYYAGTVLPSCEAKPLPFRILQEPGSPPELTAGAAQTGTATPPNAVDPR